jgi:epsin
VVLEFLLTHGPEDLPREFQSDMAAMNDLRSFNYIDDKGFNWGACMQRRTDSILTLLTDGERLKEARRLSQHGGGSATSSPSTANSSQTSRTWSFGSHYSDSPTMCLPAPPTQTTATTRSSTPTRPTTSGGRRQRRMTSTG